MNHFARLRFILDAHPAAEWQVEQNIEGTSIQVQYKGAHFRGAGISEDAAALAVLQKLEAGPGLVDTAPAFQT